MKKQILSVLAAILLLAGMAGVSEAALTTIGTATYDDGSGSANYNLIWDNNNNGNSVIWLDYTNAPTNWSAQNTWAAGLDSNLTYNINSAYTVTWGSTAWRLPSAGANPETGYNQTTSEMGDLFYNDLGLTAYPPYTIAAQLNATNFDNLYAKWYWYWSDTEYADSPNRAWIFRMDNGDQINRYKNITEYGLAVRSGQVAVPVPGAIWLLGSGLAGVVALGRRRKGSRI